MGAVYALLSCSQSKSITGRYCFTSMSTVQGRIFLAMGLPSGTLRKGESLVSLDIGIVNFGQRLLSVFSLLMLQQVQCLVAGTILLA